MKKILVAVGAGAFTIIGAACSSGGGGGGKSLSPGTYVISNGATQTDTCQALGDYSQADGQTIDITTVTADTVTMDFGGGAFDVARTGTTLDASTTSDIDWTTTAGQIAGAGGALSHGYNCMEHDIFGFTGAITGSNKLHIDQEVQYTNTTGTVADCVAANNSAFNLDLTGAWPCDSKAGFDAKKQ